MKRWRIDYYPSQGSNNSPFDYIANHEDRDAIATFVHRIPVLQENEIVDWPTKWVHKYKDKIYQLSAKSLRALFTVHNNTIIILHAFQKKTKTTPKKDGDRAISHYDQYFQTRK